MYIIKLNNGQWMLANTVAISPKSRLIFWSDMFNRAIYEYVEDVYTITPLN